MATTFVEYTGDGNATKQFTFPSYQESDVKVRVDGVLKDTSTHYNITSYTTTGGGFVVFTAGNIPSSPAKIRIYRDTNVDAAKATYTAGSSVKAADLNNNNTQLLYRAQEEQVPNLIQSYDIADQAIETSDIKDVAVTTAKIADSNITTAKIADSNITTAKIADNAVTMAKLNSGALPTDITVASANIVDGTIVEADIANSAVTSNKIADNAVTTTEILNGAVTTAKIAADAIDGTKLADNAVDSEHYTDGSIDRVHLEADIIDSTKLADNAVNSEHYVDGSIDREHLEADIIDSTKLADNAVGSEHIQANAVTDSEIATGTLDNRYFTETELTNGALDGRYFTETESDARYFNVSTGDTIKDGDAFPDNDTTIATTAAINDRIIDLVDDVGGFVPIANETSFPTANPDVNNGSGTLVSIKGISSTRTPSGGTVTIANGAGTGNTVTITGCGSTVLTAGFGVIVETTTTLHTYAFHRLVPKATEVTTVAGISSNITTVANNTSNINAVAADASDIGIVAADGTDIGLVAGSISNVNTTAGSIANVNTVAGSISNVNSVASNISNVNAVNSNESNINSAVSNASNINSAVSNASNINTVAGSISNVNTTATNISSVNNVSSNISNVNNFNDKYQIAANNPTTDGGGNALAAGDLYFNTSANELKVYTGSAWQGGVTATGTFAATTGNTFTGDNRYNDGVKALFGTGSDLQISHDGSSSLIRNNTGQLVISTGGSGNSNPVKIQPNQGEESIVAHFNNKVSLFFDNSLKFETTSSGVDVTGTLVTDGLTSAGGLTTNGGYLNLQGTATTKILLQSVDGNQIRYRNAAGTYVANLTSVGNGDTFRIQNEKQSQTLDIVSGGVDVSGNLSIPNDTGKLQIGASQDLQIYHDGSNSYVADVGTGNMNINGSVVQILNPSSTEVLAKFIQNGAAELYYDNNKKLETYTFGVKTNGVHSIVTGDNSYLALENTNGHGTAYLRNYQGDLLIESPDDVTIESGSSSEVMAKFIGDGAVELYHDNSKKLNTKSDGVLISGELQATHLDITGSSTIAGNVNHGDNVKAQFGAGSDLQFYHDGSNSYIQNITGDLFINSTSGTADDIIIQAADSVYLRTNSSEPSASFSANGPVELYYDGSKKLETSSVGVNATGNFNVTDGQLTITHSVPALNLYDNSDPNGNDYAIQVNTNLFKIVDITNSNRMGFQFGSDGNTALGGNVTFSGDIRANADSTHSIGTNTVRFANGYFDTLYGDGSNLTGISSDLVDDTSPQLGGNLDANSKTISFGDSSSSSNNRIKFGTTDNDLQIYHDGTNSRVAEGGTGNLMLTTAGSQVHLYNTSNSEDLAKFISNGAVELYNDNSKKFETTTTGAKITGSGNHSLLLSGSMGSAEHFKIQNDTSGAYIQIGMQQNDTDGLHHRAYIRAQKGSGSIAGKLELLARGSGGGTDRGWIIDAGVGIQANTSVLPETNNSYNLGSSSLRWANIFTNDLNLSNEGGANDVDGTWGNWTIQEGESDLFLKNNRSGKKYKFNLTEVV